MGPGVPSPCPGRPRGKSHPRNAGLCGKVRACGRPVWKRREVRGQEWRTEPGSAAPSRWGRTRGQVVVGAHAAREQAVSSELRIHRPSQGSVGPEPPAACAPGPLDCCPQWPSFCRGTYRTAPSPGAVSCLGDVHVCLWSGAGGTTLWWDAIKAPTGCSHFPRSAEALPEQPRASPAWQGPGLRTRPRDGSAQARDFQQEQVVASTE